jgi:hypothetical protein
LLCRELLRDSSFSGLFVLIVDPSDLARRGVLPPGRDGTGGKTFRIIRSAKGSGKMTNDK